MFSAQSRRVAREDELEAFARLGPEVKAALREAAFLWSAADIWDEIERRGWRTRLHDGEMAVLIRLNDGQAVAGVVRVIKR